MLSEVEASLALRRNASFPGMAVRDGKPGLDNFVDCVTASTSFAGAKLRSK
jgi:hypothetical protein